MLLLFCVADDDDTTTLSNLQSENPIGFGRCGVRVEKTPTFLPPKDGGEIFDGNCRDFVAADDDDDDDDDNLCVLLFK